MFYDVGVPDEQTVTNRKGVSRKVDVVPEQREKQMNRRSMRVFLKNIMQVFIPTFGMDEKKREDHYKSWADYLESKQIREDYLAQIAAEREMESAQAMMEEAAAADQTSWIDMGLEAWANAIGAGQPSSYVEDTGGASSSTGLAYPAPPRPKKQNKSDGATQTSRTTVKGNVGPRIAATASALLDNAYRTAANLTGAQF